MIQMFFFLQNKCEPQSDPPIPVRIFRPPKPSIVDRGSQRNGRTRRRSRKTRSSRTGFQFIHNFQIKIVSFGVCLFKF